MALIVLTWPCGPLGSNPIDDIVGGATGEDVYIVVANNESHVRIRQLASSFTFSASDLLVAMKICARHTIRNEQWRTGIDSTARRGMVNRAVVAITGMCCLPRQPLFAANSFLRYSNNSGGAFSIWRMAL